jgi:threonine/homoserine/homoserine lactone efflux protein
MTFLALGAGIGIVAGISPGPVLTMVVLETFRGGWLRGAAIAAGPLLADGPIVLAAVALLAQLPEGFIPAISVAGGVFLVYLGLTTLLTSRRRTAATVAPRGGLLTGLLARLLSPHPYLFWFLVGGPLLVEATREGGPWLAVAFLLGYYTTIVGSNVLLALALHRWIGRLPERLLLLLSGALLLVYGAALLATATQPSRSR